MSFGNRIVQARKDKKMSQDALAKALKATPTTVGRYERDEVKPSINEKDKDNILNTIDAMLRDAKT